MAEPFADIDTLCINTLRTLAIDAIQKADSGHPGLPLGAAPMAYVLWHRHLRFDPHAPDWINRDRFVLSAGHGSALLYSLLHVHGYDLTLADLQSFRQWESRTPGHPELGIAPGVEATTGPLGQGAANAVGMAMAEHYLAQLFNRPGHTLFDHRTYALVGDGDVMEGVCMEASSLAGHLGLAKLTFLYDCNDVTLDGPLSWSFSEDVAGRYIAMGWNVITVENGDTDLAAIDAALSGIQGQDAKPSMIIVRTTIGFGSPNKHGKSTVHGSPLGVEEVRLTKMALGWNPDAQFLIPDRARANFHLSAERGAQLHAAWRQLLTGYAKAHPISHQLLIQAIRGELPTDWDAALPQFPAGEAVATRQAGGKAINAIAAKVPWLFGGDADLSGSTSTAIKDGGSFSGQTGQGRNIHFGIREHAMGAIANGLAYHGALRPYAATFFVFSDYMRPPVRLAAMSHLPVIYVWTHDSVGLGEDGPTHQPIEHLAALRAMPNLLVVRPADANETVEAWRLTMQHRTGPVALVLSRQKLPVLDRSQVADARGLARGAYVLRDSPGGAFKAILMATGSEVHLALAAQQKLEKAGVRTRVVSMPCWELFARQNTAYRDSVLPPKLTARVAIEAGVAMGWHRWLGERGIFVGLDRFGASAPGEVALEKLGLNVARVVREVRKILGAGKARRGRPRSAQH